MRLKLFLSLAAGSLALSTVCLGDQLPLTPPKDPTNPFGSNYITYEVNQNIPIKHTRERIAYYHLGHGLGFRHNLNAQWFMGLGGALKRFKRVDKDGKLVFATFYHESLYIFRLYHPLYAFIGPKILYLLPVKSATFPVSKEPDYATEVGAALSATLAWQLHDYFILTLRYDRWRGTKTDRFHGYEGAAGIQVLLP